MSGRKGHTWVNPSRLGAARSHYEYFRRVLRLVTSPFHQAFAWLFGYFWVECPRCGDYFGGHESTWKRLDQGVAAGWDKKICSACCREETL